jgi:hypothetical protein
MPTKVVGGVVGVSLPVLNFAMPCYTLRSLLDIPYVWTIHDIYSVYVFRELSP